MHICASFFLLLSVSVCFSFTPIQILIRKHFALFFITHSPMWMVHTPRCVLTAYILISCCCLRSLARFRLAWSSFNLLQSYGSQPYGLEKCVLSFSEYMWYVRRRPQRMNEIGRHIRAHSQRCNRRWRKPKREESAEVQSSKKKMRRQKRKIGFSFHVQCSECVFQLHLIKCSLLGFPMCSLHFTFYDYVDSIQLCDTRHSLSWRAKKRRNIYRENWSVADILDLCIAVEFVFVNSFNPIVFFPP